MVRHPTNNTFTVDIRGFMMGIYSVEYEWRSSETTSLSTQGLIWNLQTEQNGDNINLTSYAGALGFRRYVSGELYNGLYVGLYGSGALINVTSPQEATATSLGLAASVGLKWLNEYNWAIDLGFSIAVPVHTHINAPDMDLSEQIVLGSIGTGVTVGIGYAW